MPCGQNDATAAERVSILLDRDLPTLRALAQSYLNRGMLDSSSYYLTVLLSKTEADLHDDQPASDSTAATFGFQLMRCWEKGIATIGSFFT